MNKKILIARREPHKAKTLSFILAGSGYKVAAYHEPNEAVEAARHERFDLAITDRSLSEEDGRLAFVESLKQAQPHLPVFLLSKDHDLDAIISYIRAGVTDVIDNPDNIRQVFESARRFLSPDAGPEGFQVTWEDLLEVERALSSIDASNADGVFQAGAAASPKELQQLKEQLSASQQQAADAASELEQIKSKLAKTESMLNDLRRHSDSGDGASSLHKTAELEEREKELEERANRVAKQKVELEIALAELDAERIEFEEQKLSPALESEAGAELQQQLEKANETRQQLEIRLQEAQRKLDQSQANAGKVEQLEGEIISLHQKLQAAKEEIEEKDFLLSQRDKEIEILKSELQDGANSEDVDRLREEKQGLECANYKLQQKVDALELEMKQFEDTHGKKQREILVEKRDMEISLREMQTKIKEEQLKLQVQQAQLKEEIRQFEQAKQNFQEDVQDLQRKQSELSQFEEKLRRIQADMGEGKPSALPERPEPFRPNAEELAEQKPERSSHPGEDAKDPKTWSKPPLERKGNRGPLRIGRSSSF